MALLLEAGLRIGIVTTGDVRLVESLRAGDLGAGRVVSAGGSGRGDWRSIDRT